jgi:hypothetical protein
MTPAILTEIFHGFPVSPDKCWDSTLITPGLLPSTAFKFISHHITQYDTVSLIKTSLTHEKKSAFILTQMVLSSHQFCSTVYQN